MHERLSVNPSIHFGKPCVAGTRVPVHDVLEVVREGVPFDRIVAEFYPDITIDDIRACVQYAIDVIDIEDIRVAV